MAVKLLKHFGIIPDKLLWARSKIWSPVKWQSSNGIWPFNLFERRPRTLRFGRLIPIHIGMLPMKSLRPRSKAINTVQFCRDGGISPERLLLRKCSERKRCKDPMELGIAPVRLLLPNFMTSNSGQCIQQPGIFPDNRFSPRWRICNLFGVPSGWHKRWEMFPEKELLERSSSVTLEEIRGNEPLNILEPR